MDMKKILGEVIKNKIFISIMCVALIGAVGFAVVKNFNKKEVVSEKKCVITFDSNGGSKVEDISITCGTKIQKPETQPSKDGFDFVGWAYNDEVFEFDKEINEDITLIATYEKKEETKVVTITFNSNGGTPIKSIEILEGSILENMPTNPTKSGYEFIGWYLENSLFDFSTKISEDVILVAQWEKVVTESSSSSENNNGVKSKYKCVADFTKETGEINVEVGYIESIYRAFDVGGSFTNDECIPVYKTSDSSVVAIVEQGREIISAVKDGVTYVYICMQDASTKNEVACFKGKINVDKTENEKYLEKSRTFSDSVAGYYWYLDGYQYAYLYPYYFGTDDAALFWDSARLAIVNNKIVASESTNEKYNNDTQIDKSFTLNLNDGKSACETIDKYNMKVNGSKLYITIGGKTYTFNKRVTKNTEKVTLSLSSNSLNINTTEPGYINVSVLPKYMLNDVFLTLDNSNESVATCRVREGNPNKVECYGNEAGSAKITVKDVGGNTNSASFTVKVTPNQPIVTTIPVTKIVLNNSSVKMLKGDTKILASTITPSNATNKNVTWSSSNTSVATVSSSGKVTAVGVGTAVVTATTEDGNHTATCEVTVEQKPLSATGSIGLITAFSNNAVISGVEVKINATGGSEKYTYYYIKLYKNDNLVYESTDTTKSSVIISGNKNGSYNAEFIVKDSDGNEYHGTIPTTTIST